MNYLIDTHILLWSLFETEKLNKNIEQILKNKNNSIYVSKISLWEISLKYSLGKLEMAGIDLNNLKKIIEKMEFEILDIETDELLSFYKLPKDSKHKDPFDRMLIWQCVCNKYIFISRDSRIKNYKRIGLKYIY